MAVNFGNAARRHWTDGQALRDQDRLVTADHLFGLSVECALKQILVVLGEPTNAEGEFQDKKWYVHLNDHLVDYGKPRLNLLGEVALMLQGRKGARASRIQDLEDLDDWRVTQRYSADDTIPAARIELHFKATRTVVATLDRLDVDGL
jgi:hypothetical protein